MTDFEALQQRLKDQRFTWLVTGGGGFIGSHLTGHLLQMGQNVVVFDNFSTGYESNLDIVRADQTGDSSDLLTVVDGDVRDLDLCRKVCEGCDHILHQAALGSVPRSIDDPVSSHASNVTGTVNLFTAAKDAGVKRVVYASSSSVYGDEPNLPKVEDRTGALLSPYAATKAINETYASVFARCYGLETIGLRYFNVFGPRQDPNGPYAAVIPKWIDDMLAGRTVMINGDGSTSRDFTFVDDVVQANLLAATVDSSTAVNRAYNIAVGERTTLTQLAEAISAGMQRIRPDLEIPAPEYRGFREGDVLHSLADISAAKTYLGFQPEVDLVNGLHATIASFLEAKP
jgi:UDP-N-acetylglucosamine 4-epimerase